MPSHLDQHQLDRAGVTVKEREALELYNPQGGRGYRTVALALDISPSTCRDRIGRAVRKLEKAGRAA